VVTLLVPPHALVAEGQAANRALAYLAHGGPLTTGDPAVAINPLFGSTFGLVYDLSTVAILCLAGLSTGIGLREFVPAYLHRLGMELEWSKSIGGLVYLFLAVKLLVIIVFDASVDAQRGAYATSVMVLFLMAAATCVLDRRRATVKLAEARGEKRPSLLLFLLRPTSFAGPLVWFAFATGALVMTRPYGVQLAFWFIGAILLTSMLTRYFRTTELRFQGFEYVDGASKMLWEELQTMDFPILAPRRPGGMGLAETEEKIRARHRIPPDMPVVFLEAELGDPSEFYQLPRLRVSQDEGRIVLHITRCASIPHVIAAAALELSKVGVAPEIHFGWSTENPLTSNLHFVLFGHGNVPWMVHELIHRAEPDPKKQPLVLVG
jgi:hypothetical protein